MSNDKSDSEGKKQDHVLNVTSEIFHTIDLPTFGKIHVSPYINVGTIMDIEKKFSSCEPTATELTDTVFAGRAQVEQPNGEYRKVTREEVAKLTDEDRTVFARAFLDQIRGDKKSSIEDTESPVEALAAYVVAEWRELQESTKELSGMIKAGFSEKTINLFKESQSLAERVIATNKLPHIAEIAKHYPALETIGSMANSPAIKAAIRMRETPTWKSVIELTESPAARAARLLEHSHIAAVERALGDPRKTAAEKALEQLNHRFEDNPLRTNTLPPLKSAEQIMAEQLGNLRKDLGERMDAVGNAATDIALQQDKTNATIMSALVDMRTKWKEDERSRRTSLWLAALSLFVSALLTAVGVVQDYFNNKSGDKHQEQVIQIITQQTQTMEQQRQLLQQLAKTNEVLASQLEETAKNSVAKSIVNKIRPDSIRSQSPTTVPSKPAQPHAP